MLFRKHGKYSENKSGEKCNVLLSVISIKVTCSGKQTHVGNCTRTVILEKDCPTNHLMLPFIDIK